MEAPGTEKNFEELSEPTTGALLVIRRFQRGFQNRPIDGAPSHRKTPMNR
jgi:hypothetical protein